MVDRHHIEYTPPWERDTMYLFDSDDDFLLFIQQNTENIEALPCFPGRVVMPESPPELKRVIFRG